MSPTYMANGFDAAESGDLPATTAHLLERRDRAMGATYRLFYREPVHVVRAEGVHLYDADGRDYLDAYNNVPVVGHANARVQRRVSEQLGRLNTHTRYLTDNVVDYAERLVATFPPGLDQVVFGCSGSDAVDLALRIARYRTGARGVIATRHAYHGTTTAAAEISPSLGPHNVIPDYVVLVDAPDPVRDGEGDAGERFRHSVVAAADELERRGHRLAAFIVDAALSSDGLVVEPTGFLRGAVDLVRERGGLYIGDEVQSGFVRLGAGWWGFARHDVLPDLVVLGKPMGNGLPISAVVGRPEHFADFGAHVRYFNTFGGNNASIAAADAVLDEIEGRGLLQRVSEVGQMLGNALRAATKGDAGIAEVRGSGLFWAVELVRDDGMTPHPERAAAVVNAMRERRVLISASGRDENVLKIRPPLVFGREYVDRLATAVEEAIGVSTRA
jgi:4-aminobutyrate aminotransferase-like enzyme